MFPRSAAKSNVMIFRSKLLRDIQTPNFCVNDTAIVTVSNCKYLGHCINGELHDDDDMARQCKQLYAQGNALIRKFYMCTETVKIMLFNSHCTSLYTSDMWSKYRNESLRRLCVAYNNIFRKMTFQARDCSASLMFISRGLPTCKMIIRKNVYNLMTNVLQSSNLLLCNIVHSDRIFFSPMWQHWRRLLYVHHF